MDNPIEEIKKRIDIVEFIGSFISLKKTGRNFKALCPFHQEKTPSFIVSPERQIWHCFGACNEGGDVIKFLMKWENLTFIEALKELAKKTGVVLKKIPFEDKVWRKKERFFYMNQLVTDFFHYLLLKNQYGKKALDYLVTRKITQATIKKFQLGYSLNNWDALIKFLKRKKFEEEEMFENGLLVKNEKGKFYDRFRGRLMFPLKDVRGNIVGFSGRLLSEKEKEAKYINSPETPIYHKRETLFGIDLAIETIKKEKNVFIVEGEFDVISPFQAGFNNFVAIKGSALTREQLMILKKYTSTITLALDNDLAGQESMIRSISEAERLDFEIKTIVFDYAKDPDEAIKVNLSQFKKIIKKPIPIYDFIIDFYQKKYSLDDPFNKKRFADEVLPFIINIHNPIVYSHYIKKLAKILNVTEESIEKIIKKINQQNKKRNLTQLIFNKNKIKREILIENYFLSLFFQSKNPFNLAKKYLEIIEVDDLLIPVNQKILQFFLEYQKLNNNFILDDFANKLPSSLKSVFDEIFLFATFEEEFTHEDFEKLVFELKKFSLKRKINKLLSDGVLEDEKKENYLKQLSNQLKEVEKKLIKL